MGEAEALASDSPERIPGLARSGTGMLRGATRRHKGRETVERAYAITSPAAASVRRRPGCWGYGGTLGH